MSGANGAMVIAKRLSGALAINDLSAAKAALPAVVELLHAATATEAQRAEKATAETEWRAALEANDVARTVSSGQRLIALSQPPLVPRILTGAQCTWPPPPIRGIGGHLAISVGRPTAIVSPGGAGKGHLSMALAWAVTMGEPLGELGCMGDPGSVLWLDYEEGHTELHRRHARYRAGLEPVNAGAGDAIHYVDCTQEGMTLDSASFVAWLRAELPKHRLCIVDHVTECWSKPLDWNQPEARLPLKAMTSLSDESGCPFMALGHVNKPDKRTGGGSTADRWRGSTALRGAVISLWVGDETTKPHQARWTHAKCNSGPKSQPFTSTVVDDESGGYRVDVELAGEEQSSDRDKAKQSKLRSKLIETVAAHPGETTDAIVALASVSKSTGTSELKALAVIGQLVFVPGDRGARRWHLPASQGRD